MKAERTARWEFKGKDYETCQTLTAQYYHRISELSGKSDDKIRDWYENRYLMAMISVLSKKYHVRSGISELFKKLVEANIKIAIFSDYPCVKERMSAIGMDEELQNLCSVIASAQERGAFKPAPRPFLEIAKELGVRPEHCLVVGDRLDTDGEGAHKAGMQFLKIESDCQIIDFSGIQFI